MKRKQLRWIFCMTMACAASLALSAPAFISYQARLTNAGGSPISTPVNLMFTFWDSETTGTQLGSGYSDLEMVTPTSGGVVNTVIGGNGSNPLPASLFESDSTWIDVSVNGTSIVPRTRLASVPYAMVAGEVDKNTTGYGAGTIRLTDELAVLAGEKNSNSNTGAFSAMMGGLSNTIGTTGVMAAVIGGQSNKAAGFKSAIVGGTKNGTGGENSFVAGGHDNLATGAGAVIVGGDTNAAGGLNGVALGGQQNIASGENSGVLAGYGNISGADSAIVGGALNTTGNPGAVVAGGFSNTASQYNCAVIAGNLNTAGGANAVAVGGVQNTSSGYNSVVVGGSQNTSLGYNSVAAGNGAQALHDNSFVWSDGTTTTYSSSDVSQFLIYAANGVGINTTTAPQTALQIGGTSGTAGIMFPDETKQVTAYRPLKILATISQVPLGPGGTATYVIPIPGFTAPSAAVTVNFDVDYPPELAVVNVRSIPDGVRYQIHNNNETGAASDIPDSHAMITILP